MWRPVKYFREHKVGRYALTAVAITSECLIEPP
jgi:hypothetical protein